MRTRFTPPNRVFRDTGGQASAFLLGLLPVLLLGASRGGYFPGSWGWASFILLVVAAVSLVGTRAVPGRRALLLLAFLAAHAAWTLTSVTWSHWPTQTALDSQRNLVYVAGFIAAIIVVRRSTLAALAGGCATAIALLSGYALLTRLLPERLGVYDPIAGYRLSEPIGYWNSLGLLCAMGMLLAIGLACSSRKRWVHVAAGTAVAIESATLYFTFSRGGVAAVAVGALALVVIERERIRALVLTLGVVAACIPIVALASRAEALTHVNQPIAAASAQGHALLWKVALLAPAAGLVVLLLSPLADRAQASRATRRAVGALTGIAIVAAIVLVTVRYGSPDTIARRVADRFTAPGADTGGDLTKHYLDLSSSGRNTQSRIAWDTWLDNPVIGTGSGTYERSFLLVRDYGKVRDAHNLYAQTLAELGVIGFVLLAGFIAATFSTLRRARLVPGAAGAGAAFFVWALHSAVDWNWQITSVTLPAMLLAAGLAVACRSTREPERARVWPHRVALAGVTALGAAALIGLAGNLYVSKATAALESGRPEQALADARRARTFAPWSTTPWLRIAQAETMMGDNRAARAALTHATGMDRRDWSLWLELAYVQTGKARLRSLAEAERWNPKAPQIAAFRESMGGG